MTALHPLSPFDVLSPFYPCDVENPFYPCDVVDVCFGANGLFLANPDVLVVVDEGSPYDLV